MGKPRNAAARQDFFAESNRRRKKRVQGNRCFNPAPHKSRTIHNDPAPRIATGRKVSVWQTAEPPRMLQTYSGQSRMVPYFK